MHVLMRYKMLHEFVVDYRAVAALYDDVVSELASVPLTAARQGRAKLGVFALYRNIVLSMTSRTRFYFEPAIGAFIAFLAGSAMYGSIGSFAAGSDHDVTKFVLFAGPSSSVGLTLEDRARTLSRELHCADAFYRAHEAIFGEPWRKHFGNKNFSMDFSCRHIALYVGREFPPLTLMDSDDGGDEDDGDSVDADDEGCNEDGEEDDEDDNSEDSSFFEAKDALPQAELPARPSSVVTAVTPETELASTESETE